MAHPLHVKARAMSLLATGEAVSRVTEMLGIPRRTVRRWQDETFELLRAELRKTVRGRALLTLAQRYRFAKNGRKKEEVQLD